WATVPPRPPYSAGHVIPAQPLAASVACQSRHSWTCAASSSADISLPSGLVDAPGGLGSACSRRNARAARRNSASAGDSSITGSVTTGERTRGCPPPAPPPPASGNRSAVRQDGPDVAGDDQWHLRPQGAA